MKRFALKKEICCMIYWLSYKQQPIIQSPQLIFFHYSCNVSNISYTIENANNKIYYVMSINRIYFLYSVETLNIEEGWSAVHRILSESCRYVKHMINCITWYEVHVPLFIWWTDPINRSLRWWFLKYFIIWCLRM